MKHWRLYFLFLFFMLIGATLISRLFFLQIKNHAFYAAMARGQHQFHENIQARRGEIFMQDKYGKLYPLAQNKEWKIVYASPREIEDPVNVAQKLSGILGLGENFLLQQLQENSSYEILATKIDNEDTISAISKAGIGGVYLSQDIGRFYPQNFLASHLLGFLGFKDDQRIGQYGLEGFYNQELTGNSGVLIGEKDVFGDWIGVAKKYLNPARDGQDLILTIDPNIQYQAEKVLREYRDKWGAESGTIIISEPTTGAVRAMASLPNFDPNQYGEVKDIEVFVNPAIQKIFEPGSAFKPVVMAAALDAGKISPETTYFDEGVVKIGGYTIRNSDDKAHKIQTMTQVLEKSLNTGAVFVARSLGIDLLKTYIRDFGFNKKTGIDLEGEVGGDIKNLYTGREINLATASYGQGIAVTPIQLVTAFSAIANQGKMMMPYVVDTFGRDDGWEIKNTPRVLKEVISPKTASRLTAMLVSVVENGYGKKASISGYWVAGKTGTAQVPFEDKKDYSDETIHSFIGFAPAFSPKFLIFIKLDNPQGINFSADSVAPAFSKLAKYILNYYEIPPER